MNNDVQQIRVQREQSQEIQQHAYALSEAVRAHLNMIRSPAYTWLKFIRRAYVLMFFVLVLLRILLWIWLWILLVVSYVGGNLVSRLMHIWMGIPVHTSTEI